jgi:hypothetical protein
VKVLAGVVLLLQIRGFNAVIVSKESRRVLPVYDGFFCTSWLATSMSSNTPSAIVNTVTIGM